MKPGLNFENSGMKLVCLAFTHSESVMWVCLGVKAMECTSRLETPPRRLTAFIHGLGGITSRSGLMLKGITRTGWMKCVNIRINCVEGSGKLPFFCVSYRLTSNY